MTGLPSRADLFCCQTLYLWSLIQGQNLPENRTAQLISKFCIKFLLPLYLNYNYFKFSIMSTLFKEDEDLSNQEKITHSACICDYILNRSKEK